MLRLCELTELLALVTVSLDMVSALFMFVLVLVMMRAECMIL